LREIVWEIEVLAAIRVGEDQVDRGQVMTRER
jgi:hypothetical protein